MKELNEVRVPPTLLPTEKRQYLQPKAKKKKKKNTKVIEYIHHFVY